jgi:NAD(P)H dehydrogenase (quinone)
MRPLIIIAHPEEASKSIGSSHTRRGFSYAKRILAQSGVEFDAIDLYADRFDPVMRQNPTRTHLDQLERYRSLIDRTDRILVLYPVWWNGPPAILKGFFDCILTPGWAYTYRRTPIKKIGVPIGLLKGKRAAIVSTSGALGFLHVLVQHSRAGRIIAYDILGFAGMRTKRFNVGGCQPFDETNALRVERSVHRALRWLRAI